MMDIQSPTCFRNATSIPRNSSSSALPLSSQVPERSDSSKFTYNRSNSYAGSMVVESQSHNFRSLTPDPHPDTVCDPNSEKLKLPSPGHSNVLLPPEGAVTPTDEPVAKKQKLQISSEQYFTGSTKDCNSDNENEVLASKVNGQHFSEQLEDNSQNESVDSIDMAQFHSRKRRLSGSVMLKNAEAYLEDAALKTGIDKSPPNLSPRTLSDTDFDGTSTGSPSVSLSGERRRRKPNIEDIVRRMKEVETDYYSEDSENEEVFNEQGVDEVDGDIEVRRPVISTTMTDEMLQKKVVEAGEGKTDFNVMKISHDEKLNENNNIIDKVRQEDIEKDNKHENPDKDGIPLPASSKPETTAVNGESVIKQVGHVTPPGTNWMANHFNVFPNFPFQPNQQEHPFSKFMSPFENKFSSPECEKDYLKCQYCERTFRRQKNLENHIENTHHGKSPVRKKSGESGDMYFKCNHCPYTTKHQSNLYVHLRIHTGKY